MQWIIAFLVICSLFMLMRLWAARLIKRRWYADDAFSVIGYAATIAQGAVTIWAVYHGAGEREADLPPESIALIAKIFQLPAAITWLVGTVSVKIAMLCLYTRIFTTTRFHRWAYGLMVAVVGYFIAFLILFMTNCIPLSNLWDPVPGGWCREITTEEYTSVAFNLVIDLGILILPMPAVWTLKMPLRNKVFVSIMFGVGLITIAIMCWRLEATTATLKDPDFTHYFTDIGLISCLELWLGVIVNCMPTIGPLFKHYVNPSLSKVSSFFSSKGSRPSQQQPVLLETIGSRRKYHNLDSSNDMHTGIVKTEISHDPRGGYTEFNGSDGAVQIRTDIETRDARQDV
ncbi:hypothetical protein KJ359_006841 [Pestalotiopsis sp. 9143b]|nr:hypothetical protein KJ359_006841 [Pestalotiopsis sp. 9143b]